MTTLFGKEIKIGDLVFINNKYEEILRIGADGFYVAMYFIASTDAQDIMSYPIISRGDRVVVDGSTSPVFFVVMEEGKYVCRKNGTYAVWDNIKLFEPFKPKKGDTIMVKENSYDPWESHKFLCMDKDLYVCNMLDKTYYSWEYAKEIK